MNKEIKKIIRTFEAVGPLLSNALKSRQFFNPQAELTEPDPDILCEYDVRIPMSEGFSVTANIFRSKKAADKGERVPVVMCAHPYNNHLTPALKKTPMGGPPQQYRLIPQAGGKPVFSELTSWESPDPNFWIPAGYAIVNMNLPGYANSEGCTPSAPAIRAMKISPAVSISSTSVSIMRLLTAKFMPWHAKARPAAVHAENKVGADPPGRPA